MWAQAVLFELVDKRIAIVSHQPRFDARSPSPCSMINVRGGKVPGLGSTFSLLELRVSTDNATNKDGISI